MQDLRKESFLVLPGDSRTVSASCGIGDDNDISYDIRGLVTRSGNADNPKAWFFS